MVVRLAVVVALVALSSACTKESCLSGEASCVVASPCPKVSFECGGLNEQLAIDTISSTAQRPGGWNGLGAKGDVKLSNAFADVVIAGLGTRNYLDSNGGSILDLAPRGQPKDVVNNIFQVVSPAGGRYIWYTSLRPIRENRVRSQYQPPGAM